MHLLHLLPLSIICFLSLCPHVAEAADIEPAPASGRKPHSHCVFGGTCQGQLQSNSDYSVNKQYCTSCHPHQSADSATGASTSRGYGYQWANFCLDCFSTTWYVRFITIVCTMHEIPDYNVYSANLVLVYMLVVWQGSRSCYYPTMVDGCPEDVSPCGTAGAVTWPETEIGQDASVPCPCGVSDPLIRELNGTRRCGGTYGTGAVWEEPECDSCQFSNTTLTLCQLAEVGWLCNGKEIWSLVLINNMGPVSFHPCMYFHFRLTAQLDLLMYWSM